MQYGALVISLDFELLWGVRDKRTIADYGPNILGVRKAVPALLDLFAQREIACTWATVGLLFFATNKALRAGLPARKPRYRPVGKGAALERLRLRRINSAMEMAARHRKLFHLWWHPHNFGVDLEENLAFLRGILDRFRMLQERYGMRSMTMGQVADEVLHGYREGRAADVRG